MPTEGADPIDIDKLISVYDESAITEILEMFLQETDDLSGKLSRAIDTQDSQASAAVAHQLKGLALALAASELNRTSSEVEQAAIAVDWELATLKFHVLQQSLDKVTTFVKEYLAR